MDPVLFFAFLTTTLLFLLVPGPSVAFATAQALKYGPRAAFIAVAGDALGTMVHIFVAIAGLTALMALSDIILPVLQIIGGLFILWMAWTALKSSRHPVPISSQRSDRATFWAGFFACVTNPKAIVFFMALFPAFISPDHSIAVQGVVYGAIFLILDAISILTYALVATFALKKASGRWLSADALSGLGLLGVGLAMIVKGYRALPAQS
ncbi:MAG: LysE family translocator [Cohaesibacter sp.]|nr:LysE family translocator [Cohaesibacter sp.]